MTEKSKETVAKAETTEPVKTVKPELTPATVKQRTFTDIQVQAINLVKDRVEVRTGTLYNLGTAQQVCEINELIYGEDPLFYMYPDTSTVVLAARHVNFYATPLSACFEVPVLEETLIKKGETKLVPLDVDLREIGLADSTDKCLKLYPRSSMHKDKIKRKFTFPHSVGIIEPDYPEQIFAKITNHGEDYTIPAGERLVQAEIAPMIRAPRVPVKMTKRTGGHGSTGN